MKILMVVSDLIVGGVTTAAFNFSDDMIKRGHDITFLDISNTATEKDLPNTKIKIAKIKGKARLWNITAKNSNGLSPLKHKCLGLVKKVLIRTNLWYPLIFKNYMVDGSYDVAIAFRQCEPCYYFVLNCVNAKKKIGYVHGDLPFMGDISSWKKYMTSFNKIAYVSNAIKEGFVKEYPELSDNAATIYNMIDIERILRLSDEAPAIELDKTKTNIITVARIENGQKQTQWIPEICERLKKDASTPFHWYVLGNGADYADMVELVKQKKVEDVLTFAGEHSNPFAIVKNADFTVLTSKWESFGLVVIESFILGKPAVVAEYPAAYEIIDSGKNGIITKQDLDDLYDNVKNMLENKDDILTNCKKYLSEYSYNNEKAYQQFMDAIKD